MRVPIFIVPLGAALGVVVALLLHGKDRRVSADATAPPATRAAPVRHISSRRWGRSPTPTHVVRSGAKADPDEDIIGSVDPTSKSYDPITLFNALGMIPSEIMDREPRDPAFADRVEPALAKRLSERLRRGGFEIDMDVHCRTSSCDLVLRGANADTDVSTALNTLDLHRLAETVQVGPPRDRGDTATPAVWIVLLFSAETRDPETFERRLRQHEAHDEPPAP